MSLLSTAATLLLLAAPAPPSSIGASDLDGDGVADRVRLEQRGTDGLWIVAETASGITASRPIGDSEIPFQLDGRESRLTVRDVTGDGRAEILVAASSGGRGLLYVLRLRGSSLVSLHADAEAFVSETGSFPDALAVDSKGRVTIASIAHDAVAGPREALFTYEWSAKDGFTLTATDRATDD